jgi:hypothetical protein
MGGNWVVQLAQHHDLWVLTEANRFAPALTRYLDRHCPELKSAIHVVGIPRKRFGENYGNISFTTGRTGFGREMLSEWRASCTNR